MNSKFDHFFKGMAGHKITIISFLIPLGFVIFLTAFNENLIFQYSEGSHEALITTSLFSYLGLAIIVGAIVWIALVLIARRSF